MMKRETMTKRDSITPDSSGSAPGISNPEARNAPPSVAPSMRRTDSVRELRPVHPWLVWWFRGVARRRLRRNFRALRVAHMERTPAADRETALIVYTNHPSWWDPLTAFVLAPHLIGRRNFYAPMETASLQRYKLFRRLGLFPVEVETPRGAVQFLRGAELVLSRGDVLGVTAQGSFTDVRVCPPGLKPGVAALLSRFERDGRRVIALPLALEYTFWDQRLPEALACVGEAVLVDPDMALAQGGASATERWAALLEKRLAQTQAELAALAITREPANFTTLLRGRRGAAGFYGIWQQFQGAMRRGGVAPVDHEAHSGNPVHVRANQQPR